MKWLLVAASAMFFALVVAVFAYAYFTPHLTMKAIHEAAASGDTKALEEYVDFPKVKDSLKRQIQDRIDEGARQSSNPLAAFGSALAGALAAPAVDTLVTSDNVARLLRGEGFGSQGSQKSEFDDESLVMSYDGVNRFVTTDRKSGFSFVLERDGLFTWKLSEVVLPESWRLPTLSAPGALKPATPR